LQFFIYYIKIIITKLRQYAQSALFKGKTGVGTPFLLSCLADAVVGRWTRDRKVASMIPGGDAIKSTRSTQPSIPRGR